MATPSGRDDERPREVDGRARSAHGRSSEAEIPGARPETEDGHGVQPTRILANAGLRAVADIGSKLATAALYLIVARKTGPSQFGIFAFAISFSGIAVMLGQFGQEFVLVREVARDRTKLDEYYSSVMLSRLMLGVPPLLIALGIASLTGMSAHTRLVILLMGFGFLGDYMIQVSFAVFQAYERVGFLPVVLITQRWVTTSVAITLVYAGGGIVAVAAVYCAGASLAAMLAAWLLYHKVVRPRFRLDARGALAVTRKATPIGLGMVALTLMTRIDMVMLAAFKATFAVGQYSAAYRLLDTTAFVAWSVNVAVLPTMARLTVSTVPSIGSVFQRALKLVLAITVPAAVGAAILSGPIVSLLYGAEFHKAAGALTLLALTITLAPVSALTSQLLYAQGAGRVVALIYAAVFLENVVVNLILIPRYSLNGAAAGTSISEVLVSATLLFSARSLCGRLALRRMLAGCLLGSLAAAGVMVTFHSRLAIAVPVAVVVYLTVFLGHERLVFPEDFGVARSFLARVAHRPDSAVSTAG